MLQRRRLSLVLVMAILLVLPATALAGLTLNYEGSLKIPRRSSSPKEYYARGAAFAPTGTPVLGGGTLSEPSLLVGYSWHQTSVEYTQLPTPVKTLAELVVAPTAVTSTTVVDRPGSTVLGDVDSAGSMWDTDQYTSGGGHPGGYSDPGVHMLGATSLSPNYGVQESGWPAGWAGTVCLRRGDGAGGDLASDGTTVGAKFLYVQRTHADGESAYVHEVTRSDATTMSSTLLFKRSTGDFNTTDRFVQYVRDTSGAEYIMLSYEQGHAGDSHVIEFYDPATAIGGVLNPAPAYSLDIGPDIAAGAGWLHSGSVVGAAAVDWDNSQLYVVDGRYQEVRIHVFTAQGPVTPPIPEPGTLGLTLLGLPFLFGRRNRGRRMSRKWMSVLGLVAVALLALPVTGFAGTYYVRGDGSGSDANGGTAGWGDAYATLQKAFDQLTGGTHTINVQESTGAQKYDVAGRNARFNGITLTVDGGWSNVDAAPVQSGRSLVSDTDGTVDEIGLELRSTGSAHGQPLTLTINKVDVADVGRGVRMYHPSNVDGSPMSLTLTDSAITANTHGVDLEYNKDPRFGGGAKLVTDNVDIAGGQSGAGDGIHVLGWIGGSVIENTDITTPTGAGISLQNRGPSSNWAGGYTLTVKDTVVDNCAGDGIYKTDTVSSHYNTTSVITMERVEVSNVGQAAQGGDGIYLSQNQGSSISTMQVDLTNVLVANATAGTGSPGYGIALDGNPDANGARVAATLINCTITDVDDDLVYLVSSSNAGNSATIRNSIFSDPDDDGVVVQDLSASGPAVTESYNDFFGYGGATSEILRNGVSVALDITDLTSDPAFVASGADPYNLGPGSLSIDAASALYAPDEDILGNPRPAGSGDDMGAYEVQPLPIPEPGTLGLTLLGLPFLFGRRKRGRKMSRKWMSFLGLVALALLLAPMTAMAGLTVSYEGSFNLPNASAWGDYYYQRAVYVPDGNTRPGSGVSVTGPSLVVWTQHKGRVREVNALPAPATAGLGTATLLLNTSGGTEYQGSGYYSAVTCVDSAGNLWNPQGANQWGPAMYNNPGTHVLGQSAQPALSKEAGWPSSSYLSHGGGTLRKGDGLGNDLPKDGTTVGAKFLTNSRKSEDLGSGSQYYTAVVESTRVDASNMSSTPLFYAPHTGHRPMEYVREMDGDEWFVLWLPGAHTGDSFTLDFFASACAGNTTTPTLPTEQIDIGPAIAAGAGWINSATYIRYVGVDWDNSQLYVLEGNGAYGAPNARDGRIHVFTVGEPAPPIPEPAGLGLVGMALLAIRRKRS